MINKEELNKLNPQQRIRKLRQLKREMKKNAVEINKIITESEHQIRIDKIAVEVAPELRPVDISGLFVPAEGLERDVQVSKAENEPNAAQQGYVQNAEYADYKPATATSEERALPKDSVGEPTRILKYESETDKVADAVVSSKTVPVKLRRYTGSV